MTQRWLTKEEQQAWLALVSSTALLDVALDRQLQRDSGLSHAAYGILARLSAAPGRTLHMHELALATNSSQSRLSHAASRLEDQGLIERSKCPHSRRAVHATLTECGYQTVAAAAPAHVDLVRRLVFDRLDPTQVAGLHEIGRTVLAALDEAGFPVPVTGVHDEPDARRR